MPFAKHQLVNYSRKTALSDTFPVFLILWELASGPIFKPFWISSPSEIFVRLWEWTSTDFHGYLGYETFPYPEYSEVFFGNEYKVLRGGSWASRPAAIRSTFRNWDYPIRRQIFSGFRCARDD